MRIGLAFTHILPRPTWTGCSHVSGLGDSLDRFVLHFQSRISVLRIEKGKLSRKGGCERKAYPHRVYPDRNRIRLRVNVALHPERL